MPAVEAKASFRVVESFRANLGGAGKTPTRIAGLSRWDVRPAYGMMHRTGRCDNVPLGRAHVPNREVMR